MNAYATLKQFGLPAVAGSLAVCVSHPLELTKVRLQLDNELQARGSAGRYGGWLDCVRESWRAGGVGNLWSGLRFGVAREFAFNCARIGSFEPALAVVGHPMAAGFLCGSLGGCVANPVEVLKVRFQALGGATGHQHAAFSNAGFWASLRRLVADEGWRACAKGLGVSTRARPGTQLPAYYELKRRCGAAGLDADSPARVNGPAGNARYADAVDAFRKILAAEGPTAFYKGAGSHFLRLGPHMVLVFVILEQLRLVAP
ncbi:oxidative phosphorylation uncoupler [Aureococcus anophagefferens]|nr:oxidative phosphorylation uncoupler [Aureococcus anophagefferens]